MPLGRLDGRPVPPLHTLLGSGLDARQFTDISLVTTDRLITPTSEFYVRTAHAPELPAASGWQLTIGGLARAEQTVGVDVLQRDARDMGVRLMECAGNADPANFGLLSAASWSGVPVAAVLDRVPPSTGGRRVRVTGFDDDRRPSATSNPGASWIFTLEELERAGAFLAFGMNGAPLTADHGAPVRLVVPNYYGCSCIKWVTRLDWVSDDEPATLQMIEFSTRTHQRGVPRAARDYEPPVIELAATPIRVEQWAVRRDGTDRRAYRVVGLRWGGTSRHVPLTIRFSSRERFVPVTDVPATDNPSSWTLWSHTWDPDSPGRYQIALAVADPAVPARRLGLYYYTREVDIDTV
jgi:DMSO/TMAO reductase YedYZ molybdopterin-dependent catalytic subunit